MGIFLEISQRLSGATDDLKYHLQNMMKAAIFYDVPEKKPWKANNVLNPQCSE